MNTVNLTEEFARIQKASPVSHRDDKLFQALEANKKMVQCIDEMAERVEALQRANEGQIQRLEKLEKLLQGEKKKGKAGK